MYSNFTFNGFGNDEFGVVCVGFDFASPTTYAGQTTKLTTELSSLGREFEIVDQPYSEPMSFTFQIVNKDGSKIGQEQERRITKWLCHRGEYSWMFIQEHRFSDIFFKANISNPKIIVIQDVIGMEFTVTTSFATCFSDEYEYSFSLTHDDNNVELYLANDDECEIYPYVEITLNEPGDLIIKNTVDNDDYFFKISNVVAGEKIIIDNELPLIETNISTHKAWNDFNKKWLRLYDDYNHIEVNLECIMTIKYRETRRLIIY